MNRVIATDAANDEQCETVPMVDAHAPAISVVIPALNAAQTLAVQLDAVLDQATDFQFEVVVADNGSTDGTPQIVEQFAARDDRVRLVDASEAPLGGAAAKNWGVRAANAPLIAFCDADDMVAPQWLANLYDALQHDPVVVCTRDFSRLNPPSEAGPAVTTYSMGKAPGISGGAFGIARDLYIDAGEFDEFFAGAVDSEFAVRLFLISGRVPGIAHGSVVHVRNPRGLKSQFRRARALGRSIPVLEQRFPTVMLTPVPLWKKAAWLALRLAWLARADRREQWVTQAGRLWGYVEGRRNAARDVTDNVVGGASTI